MQKSREENPKEIHELEMVPSALREMAEALIGTCGLSVSERLYRAANKAEQASERIVKIKSISSELVTAAEAIKKSHYAPKMERLSAFLKIPYSKEFLGKIPDEYRDEWRLLNDQLSRAKSHLEMFSSASWAAYRGPNATKNIALRLRGDEILGDDMLLLATNSTRIADAELMNAGFALLSVARHLDNLIGIILPILSIFDCPDACELGTFRYCEAGDVYFTPYEDSPQDTKDVDNAINILEGAGWLLPGKYLTPGGKKMIKEIARMLKKLKEKIDEKKIYRLGYGVHVVLKYEECVDGMCGNHWVSKTKVVKIDPPAAKRHSLNKLGWRPSVIEDLGKNEAKTKAQMNEFKSLAENQCP